MTTRNRTLKLEDVSFELPASWTGQVLASGPIEDGFRPNLVAVVGACIDGETATEFAQRMLPELKRTTVEYRLVREGPAIFGQVSGFLREHTFLHEGVRVGQMQLYVVKNGQARTFTFTHLATKMNAARPQAEALFASLRLAAPAEELLKSAGRQVRA